jgi:hypothetical protein
MKYAIEMDSGVMIYIPSLIKTDSGIQRLIEKDNRHTERKVISQACLYLFKIRKGY